MARKLFTHGIPVGWALTLALVLGGCASPEASTVCGTSYSVQAEPGVSIQGNGSQLFALKTDDARASYWTARVIWGQGKAVILRVLAGRDVDHLVSYGDFRPTGITKATIPRQQTGELPGEIKGTANRIVYICGESGH